MDQFTRHFFPDHQAPGAEFKLSNDCESFTYYRTNLRTTFDNMVDNRRFVSTQPMTAAGKMTASITGSCSCLDGMTRQYLTPEGTMNLTMLGEGLKASAGLPTANWSALMGNMQHWNWADNHLTLLMNALRFVFLRRLTAAGAGNLNVNLADYDDGHVTVDRNQYFPANYPAVNQWDWPCGNAADSLPTFERLTVAAPVAGVAAVDLRGLNMAEAQFMLIMTGEWRRRSRYRLDYQFPRLIDLLSYRADDAVTNVNFTLATEEGVRSQPPPLPSWNVAWVALRKYVTQNRLFGQFSTALYMISAMAYQFLPATAEAQYWLGLNWTASLPQFHPIRGRFNILNEGEAALVSHRALSEWNYLNNRIEKVNLIALVFCQAVQTGIAVRATRRGLEDNPVDLYNTEMDFYSVTNFLSAAASECARIDVPLSGMSNVYLFCTENFEAYADDREVVTTNNDVEGLGGYLTRVANATRMEEQLMPRAEAIAAGLYADPVAPAGALPPMPPPGTVERQAMIVANTNTLTIADAAQRETAFIASYEEALAQLTAQYSPPPPAMVTVNVQVPDDEVRIVVPWMPFAGAPVLLLPLNCFPYTTPFNMAGTIARTDGTAHRNVWEVSWAKAWEVANLNRLAGYDTSFLDDGGIAGPTNFFSPNDVNLVWPLSRKPDRAASRAVLNGRTERANLFIQLPNFSTRFFNQPVDYRLNVVERGVASGARQGMEAISEYGGAAMLTRGVTTGYQVPDGVARLRGYISRQAADFRFAGDVQAGVIPGAEVVPAAPAV